MEALGSRPALCGLKGGYSGQTNNVGIDHINLIYQDCTIIIQIIVKNSDDDQVLCSDVQESESTGRQRPSSQETGTCVCVCGCVWVECMRV